MRELGLTIIAFADRYGWFLLMASGLFEVLWAITLKMSNGYTKLIPTLATIPFALASAGLLALAMRTIPMGVSYVVWAGIGALGSVSIGMLYFGDEITPLRLVFMALIVCGVIGLKVAHLMGGGNPS